MVAHILVVIGILTALSGSLSCSPGSYSGPVESITIGTTTSEVNALILIAQDKGYFADNGIDLNHKIYTSGVAALDGMFKSEADMATGSEFAFVGEALSGEDIGTISVINRSSIEYLLGRVDRGINVISDLKGKSIGVPMGSRPEFALDRFLLLNGLNASEMTLVNVPVNQSVDALVSGGVDAVAAWQPYISRIRDRMGDGVIIWDVQKDQPSYSLVMCRADWIKENPELISRFIKSLTMAESYIEANPEVTKSFLQNKLNYDEVYMLNVWSDYNFELSLAQPLILAMEDQARWMISNNLTDQKTVPNFLDYIYTDGLKSIRPDSVRIAGK